MFVAKIFDELTTKEIYEILKACAAVFVVEQNMVYQDILLKNRSHMRM